MRESNRAAVMSAQAARDSVDFAKTSAAASDAAQARTLALAERSAGAAEVAASLANRSLTATQNAFRLDQRAWIAPSEYGKPVVGEGAPARFAVFFKNTGKTPALEVSALTVTAGVRAPDECPPRNAPRYDPVTAPSNAVLFPGDQMSQDVATSEPASAALLASIKKGSVVYCFLGVIGYRDVFGQRHVTTFCNQLEHDLNQPS